MAGLINQYSFPLLLAVLAISLAFLLPIKRPLHRFFATGALVAALLGGYAYLRPGASTVATVSAADELLATAAVEGRPVFIEFFYNTCSQCLAAEPSVSSLVSDIKGEASVLRVNVSDNVGGALTRRFGVTRTPTYLVLGADGTVRYRKSFGFPDHSTIKYALSQG